MKKSIWYTIQVPLEGNWQLLTEWFLRGRCVNHVNTRVNTDPRKRIRTIMTTIRSCPNLYHFSQDIIVCNFGTARPIDLIQKPKCKFWRGLYHILSRKILKNFSFLMSITTRDAHSGHYSVWTNIHHCIFRLSHTKSMAFCWKKSISPHTRMDQLCLFQ